MDMKVSVRTWMNGGILKKRFKEMLTVVGVVVVEYVAVPELRSCGVRLTLCAT